MTGSAKVGPNAIEKLVAVVEALATESKVSRIARETGLATSTVHRILRSLVRAGWAYEDNDRGYLLGERLLAIVAEASSSEPPSLMPVKKPAAHNEQWCSSRSRWVRVITWEGRALRGGCHG
jgi:hypothetical protein